MEMERKNETFKIMFFKLLFIVSSNKGLNNRAQSGKPKQTTLRNLTSLPNKLFARQRFAARVQKPYPTESSYLRAFPSESFRKGSKKKPKKINEK